MTTETRRLRRTSLADEYTIETSEVVIGDHIAFVERVYSGPYRERRHAGDRLVLAEVLDESYDKYGNRWLRLRTIGGEGLMPPRPGEIIRRAERTLYWSMCQRKPWLPEEDRSYYAHALQEMRSAARSSREAEEPTD